PTSRTASTAPRARRNSSWRARWTAWRPAWTRCSPTSARSSSSRACRPLPRATCRSAADAGVDAGGDAMTLATQPAATAPPSTGAAVSPWPIFWIASVAAFLVSLDTTMLYAAFGALRAGFPGASAADLSWVLNAYTVVYAAMLIPAGGLADAHGRKRVFLLG